MLIAARHLVDRFRHPRSRADEVRAVRLRLVEQPSAAQASAEQTALARELLRLRRALIDALGSVTSCSGCARHHPEPHGHWAGGHCCGGRTDELFGDDELAALRLGGTTPERLEPPRSDHAGCAFRGPRGCSLEAADRPNLCVRYLCRDLERELGDRGDRAEIKALAAQIDVAFRRFQRLRQRGPSE